MVALGARGMSVLGESNAGLIVYKRGFVGICWMVFGYRMWMNEAIEVPA